ncbi:MAG TPA: SUMF1/EgtB/PvdO family nonheme iron enzyme [Acidobacteriota bacterium]|nr:SUMF1/EgtB/PvdO family nonheme iron enzyme [Acidobacteriota bacterium]
MKKIHTAGIVAIILLIFSVAIAISQLRKKQEIESLHFSRQETEFLVSAPAGVSSSLFRAGKTLEDFQKITDIQGSTLWLSPANYFLNAKFPDGNVFYYPVTTVGYRLGPDESAFAVTIRPQKATPPTLANAIPEYAYIPAGTFLFGDKLNPQEPHYLWLTSYFISRFEVSNFEFRQFIHDSIGYNDSRNWEIAGIQWKQNHRHESSASIKPDDSEYVRFGQPDQPVTRVCWYEASAYCKWLTRKYGKNQWLFSLPSEAEWEKAARGPDSFDYGLGMTISDDEAALYNWKKNPDAAVTVVGNLKTQRSFHANRYGIYHASGNVVEWTQSVFLPFNRSKPYDEYQRNRLDLSGQRVARGGSWYSASIALLYLPYRDAFQQDIRNHDLGFRIVAKPVF